MKRLCLDCGKEEKRIPYIVGRCKPCYKKYMARKEQLRKEGFYKNMNKLRQPRYFNFLREEE